MKLNRILLPVILGIAVLCPGSLLAADHQNLEEGMPAHVEDAYPIGFRGREFQWLARYDRTDDNKDLFVLEPRLEYGFARNWQAKVAVPFRLGSADKTGSGDIGLEAFYNLNAESLSTPAFAIAVRADVPTGKDSEGVDTTLKAIATRTLGRTTRFHRLHVNAEWTRNAQAKEEEREDLFAAVLGYSRLLNPDTMLVLDYAFEQEREEDKESHILEAGIRRQVDPLTVWSMGLGAGIGAESPPFRAVLAYQRSF